MESRGARRTAAAVVMLVAALAASPVRAGAAATGEGQAHAGAARSGSLAATATVPRPAGYTVTGLDVSNHQGTIDWGAVAAAGAKFSYAKATEGVGYVDPYFGANNSGAKRNGLYAGAYAFGRPDNGTGTGAQQADYLVDNSAWAADGRTLPLMLDVEWPYTSGGSYIASYPCWGLSTAQMRTWIHDFVNEVRARTGRPAMIYTNANWWNPCTGNDASLGGNPLFIANWSTSGPTLPAGWTDWTLWQYDDSGMFPGDQDVFNGSLAGLAALGGGVAGLPDVTGDGYHDLVGIGADGALYLYRNNRTTNTPYGGGVQIGAGWLAFDRVVQADVTGDGFADLLATRPDGSLWLYPNSGLSPPYGSGRQIGSGWAGFSLLAAGPVTGDGYADILATRDDGSLWLYPNIGADAPYGAGRQIGAGWSEFVTVLAADASGDGRADILGNRTDGSLWLYRNNGTSSPYGTGQVIGSGWGMFDRVAAGDVTGDRWTDVLATRSDGTLWLYRNGHGSLPYATGSQIGAGWGAYDLVG